MSRKADGAGGEQETEGRQLVEFYLLLPGGKACTFYVFTRKPRTSVHRSLTPLPMLAGPKWDPGPRLRLHLTPHLMRQLECIQLSKESNN